MEDIKKLLSESPGIVLLDDPENSVYPLAREAAGKDEVFVEESEGISALKTD